MCKLPFLVVKLYTRYMQVFIKSGAIDLTSLSLVRYSGSRARARGQGWDRLGVHYIDRCTLTDSLPLIRVIGHFHVRKIFPHLLHKLTWGKTDGLDIVRPIGQQK